MDLEQLEVCVPNQSVKSTAPRARVPEPLFERVEEQHGPGGPRHFGDLVVFAEGETDRSCGRGAARQHRARAVRLSQHVRLGAARRWGRGHAAALTAQPRRERQAPVDAAITCSKRSQPSGEQQNETGCSHTYKHIGVRGD